MKHLIITLFMLLCSGCTAFVEHNTRHSFPVTTTMQISIHKMTGGDNKVLGYAEIRGDTCKVYLRTYPRCLQHEIRHCYELNWHEGRDTSEDC